MTQEFDLSKRKFPKETWEDRARERNTLENQQSINKGFNLSEKIDTTKQSVGYEGNLDVEDVKEFIKRLKELIPDMEYGTAKIIYEGIDTLAGQKLSGKLK